MRTQRVSVPAILAVLATIVAVLSMVLVGRPSPAVASASDTSSSDTSPSENPWPARRVLNIAHQGGEIEAPSNTLYAYKTALAKGAEMLELDVHATSDGRLVVLHDATVDRTTNGTGRVDTLTLAQIKGLDAAHWFVPDCGTCHDRPADSYAYRGFATGARPIPPGMGDFTPADFRIPTLDEVLSAFPDTMITIEIKATWPSTAAYERKVADLLREFGRTDDTIVTSFNDLSVQRFKLHNAQVSTAPGVAQIAAFWASSLGPAPGIRLPGHHALQVPTERDGLTLLTADFVRDAHRNGLAVHVWTIDDRAEMERLVALGVDGIMTNRPTVLEEVLSTNALAGSGPRL